MFKNATIYTVSGLKSLEDMEAAFSVKAFEPCTPTQEKSVGWVRPRCFDHGAFVEVVNGQRIAKFQIETKSVPASAVKRELDKRAAAIEAATGRKLGRKATRELKEQIAFDLLPQAFPKTKAVWVWFDVQNQRMVIDSVSQSVLDDVTSAVSVCAEKLDALWTRDYPQSAMTAWLTGGGNSSEFDVGRYCEMLSLTEFVTFRNCNLFGDDVRQQFALGKLPVALELGYQDACHFRLNVALWLTGIDIIGTETDNEDKFDADVFLTTTTLTRVIDALVAELGGVQK